MGDAGSRETDAAPALRREPFVFTGTAREYFGIWIVNVLLTIVTLGAYSAWAKVRRMRYFHGSTTLAGGSFDYHGRPLQILLGRIVVLIVFAAYNLALNIFFEAGLVIGGLFLFVVPYFIMRGMRFRARVTSYRNVRFDFTGGYGGALLAFVVGGILTWVTLGILAPVASRWMWGYTLGNLTWGGRKVECDPALGALYRQWRLPAVLLSGGVILVALASTAIGMALGPGLSGYVGGGGGSGTVFAALLILLYVGFVPVFMLYLLAGLIYHAGSRNVALDETAFDGRHFLASSLSRWRFAWIAIGNFIATVASLGLLRPWAAVRMARYLAACTALDSIGSLDEYAGQVQREGGATGSEYMDVEGLDFGV